MRKRYPPIFDEVDIKIWNQNTDYQYHKRFTQIIDNFYRLRSQGNIQSYPAYNHRQCVDEIKNSIINDMYDDGFDLTVRYFFNYNLQKTLKGQYRIRKLHVPISYMRYQCRDCKNKQKQEDKDKDKDSKKKNKKRRWTSSLGTISLNFQIIPINIYNQIVAKKQRINTKNYVYSTPFIILFHLKLYRMYCKQCYNKNKFNKWGIPYVYKPCLLFIKDKLCQKISDILTGTKNINNKKETKLYAPKLINHKQQLCEACLKGTCDFSTRRINQTHQQNL